MIRELLTLIIDKVPVQYYIRFSRERNHFYFQPTLKNKTAPTFTLFKNEEEWKTEDDIDALILDQAKQKIKEINSDSIFDNL